MRIAPTGRRLRIILVQPCGQLLDARHTLFGRELPSRAHQAFDLGLVLLGQIVEHVAQLVGATALHRLMATEDGIDCGSQRFGAVAVAKAAADFHRPICVSACEESGFLVAFARMEGAPLRSISISQGKAFTAVRLGVPTDKFLTRLQQDHLEASYFGGHLIPLPGGNLLKVANGKVLGAIGVNGLALNEDQSITETLVEMANSGKL